MTLYRLPFLNDGLWHGAKNWDDPTLVDKHDPYQAYAFDIGHPVGGIVLAARSGHVISVEHVGGNTKVDPKVPPGGSLVRIRHADNSVALYAHLKFNSIAVSASPQQYVLQGTRLGLSGHTGNSTGPHLHFEVRSFWNSEPNDLGPTIPVQFEDTFHTAWRPIHTDLYASNNVVLRQEGWRYCKNCHGLFYGDEPAAGVKGGVCPEGGAKHSAVTSGNYILSRGPGATGQLNWQWCSNCQGLFFAGNKGGVCPANKGPHLHNETGGYVIATGSDAPGQHNWRWCKKCDGLFLADSPGSNCPADGSEHAMGAGEYALVGMEKGEGETNWRHGIKCHGMYYAGSFVSVCPSGSLHDKAAGSSRDYVMLRDYLNSGVPDQIRPPNAPGQTGWRRCHKCQGLFFGGNPGSKCPLDHQPHLSTDANYTLLPYRPTAPGERGWRWCDKCQGLYFGNALNTTCPAGEHHRTPSDGEYAVLCDGIWGQ